MKIVNFVAFQLGWFACVLGAANDLSLWGSVVAMLLVATHVALHRPRIVDVQLVLAASLFGWTAESLQHWAGVTSFDDGGPWLWSCPLWMVMLWSLFGTTLNSSLAWLRSRRWLSALLGAVAGPIAYFGGERLGALRLAGDPVAATASVALVYSVAMPTLLATAGWLERKHTSQTGASP